MIKRHTFGLKKTLYAGLALLFCCMLSSCNLGQAAPAEPYDETTSQGETVPIEGQTDLQPLDTGVTATPEIEIQPTVTPVPELLPEETLGPISIEGTEHRTMEAVTVRVRHGKSVSTVICSWVHQDTGTTGALGSPVTNTIDDITLEEAYSFTPEMAGAYAVNCTGVALTASGQRAVNAAGTPFSVEAKG
ncbi:MAG: hypothetical protein JXJ17_13115 [Anaerolineae bacterium]|nr:hypothetical protein [Anaerolineae bacterium]